ncbi:MAG: AT hook domain-containing protein, partial [Erysipelotrichales bacterium]|nr:AT hook domain-containing protein [Erysipelotrichales bacterium]
YQATRGRKMPLPNKLTEILKRMEDRDAYYSVALVDSPIYRKQWNEIPLAAKERLQVSVILADRLGHVLEMK